MNTSASLSSSSLSSMNSSAASPSSSSAPVSPFSASSSAGVEAAIAPSLQAVIELFDTDLHGEIVPFYVFDFPLFYRNV